MTRKYFGTDGVRGTVGTTPMTADFVLRLGYAAGKVLAQRGIGKSGGQEAHPSVLIAKDTRISGYMIEAALEAGFSAAGVDVLLCGPLPTPGVAYLTRALRLSAGVVISASHNPYPDNGIKFFSGDGFKLPDDTEASIERQMEQPMGCNEAARLGRARPSVAASLHPIGRSICCSIDSSVSSGSLKPSPEKNLMPLSGYGLCDALITTPAESRSARVRYATPGVGNGPQSSTSTPAAENPASSADSIM